MSAPIHTLLADRLGISEEKAEKLLGAMLREVRKRARHEGVRLPNLGKFSEEHGRLTFEPNDSLARAVNHRFEGLGSEDLASAPDTGDDEDDTSDEGPNTITLGYQDSSNWSPIDAEEEESSEDDEPDTAEFEVPSADDAADTEELRASGSEAQPASDPEQTAREPDSSESDQTDTEELYPLVEGMSDEPEPSQPSSASSSSDRGDERDEEHDALSGIWEGEDDSGSDPTDTSTSSEPDPSAFEPDFPTSETEQDFAERTAEPERAPEPPSEPAATAPPEADATTEAGAKERSTSLRVLASLLVLLLVGGGAWYILGQQGTVPPPGSTLAQAKEQVQPLVQDLPGVGSNTASESGPAASSASDPPEEEDASQTTTTATTSSEDTDSPSSTSSTAGADEAPAGIDRASGGWTIVVASRTQRNAASSLVDDYRSRFSDQQVPIDVLEGNVGNTTRYRVGVGQFDSQQAAQQFLSQFDDQLPDGAWTLGL